MSGCVIAIDGPAASGKSSVARGVATALDFLFVSSGYFYRALAWGSITDHISIPTTPRILDQWIAGRHLEFQNSADGTRLFLDGDDASPHLSEPEVTSRVSQIAANPAIRNLVNSNLRTLSASHDLVLEGRDIGSVVFPETPYKFYLDASPYERARRREREGLADTVAERDRLDSTRATAPLSVPSGAIIIDTTHLSLEEVVNNVLDRLNGSLP